MLKKRVIPVLLLKNGRMVKTQQFSRFKDVGDPLQTVRVYDAQGADELMILDISASIEGRKQALDVLSASARECLIPLTLGGGIQSIEDAQIAFEAGADKVCISTAIVEKPSLISEFDNYFGGANLTACIDVKLNFKKQYKVTKLSGQVMTDKDPLEWAGEVMSLGAGEIMLHFVDRDGMMNDGYDIELLAELTQIASVPVIACGGVGTLAHILSGVTEGGASGVAAASIFHFTDQSPIRTHSYLHNAGIPVCLV